MYTPERHPDFHHPWVIDGSDVSIARPLSVPLERVLDCPQAQQMVHNLGIPELLPTLSRVMALRDGQAPDQHDLQVLINDGLSAATARLRSGIIAVEHHVGDSREQAEEQNSRSVIAVRELLRRMFQQAIEVVAEHSDLIASNVTMHDCLLAEYRAAALNGKHQVIPRLLGAHSDTDFADVIHTSGVDMVVDAHVPPDIIISQTGFKRRNPADVKVEDHKKLLDALDGFTFDGELYDQVVVGDERMGQAVYYAPKAAQVMQSLQLLVPSAYSEPVGGTAQAKPVVILGFPAELIQGLEISAIEPWGSDVDQEHGVFSVTREDGSLLVLVTDMTMANYVGIPKKTFFKALGSCQVWNSTMTLASLGVAVEQPDHRLTNACYPDEGKWDPAKFVNNVSRRIQYDSSGDIDRDSNTPATNEIVDRLSENMRVPLHGAWYTMAQRGSRPDQIAEALAEREAGLMVFLGQSKAGKGEIRHALSDMDRALYEIMSRLSQKQKTRRIGDLLMGGLQYTMEQVQDDMGYAGLDENLQISIGGYEAGAFENLDEVEGKSGAHKTTIYSFNADGTRKYGEKNKRAITAEDVQDACLEDEQRADVWMIAGNQKLGNPDLWKDGKRVVAVDLEQFLAAKQNYVFEPGNSLDASGVQNSTDAGDEFMGSHVAAGETNQNLGKINETMHRFDERARKAAGLPPPKYYLVYTGPAEGGEEVPSWLEPYDLQAYEHNPREAGYMQAARELRSAQGPQSEFHEYYVLIERVLAQVFGQEISYNDFVYWYQKLESHSQEDIMRHVASALNEAIDGEESIEGALVDGLQIAEIFSEDEVGANDHRQSHRADWADAIRSRGLEEPDWGRNKFEAERTEMRARLSRVAPALARTLPDRSS